MMNKPTNREKFAPKIHKLPGQIVNKEPKKVYDKQSSFLGNTYYKLKIIAEEQTKKYLFAYPNLVSKEIFQTIEQSHYLDKRYIFFCEKRKRGWVLHNWEELTINFENIGKENHAKN